MEAQRPAFAALALGFTTALALAVALRSAYAQLRADLDAVNAKLKVRKPALIILVRHGESEANVDSSKYRDVGDPHISLTERGQCTRSPSPHSCRVRHAPARRQACPQ